jgi:hypothetical protein
MKLLEIADGFQLQMAFKKLKADGYNIDLPKGATPANTPFIFIQGAGTITAQVYYGSEGKNEKSHWVVVWFVTGLRSDSDDYDTFTEVLKALNPLKPKSATNESADEPLLFTMVRRLIGKGVKVMAKAHGKTFMAGRMDDLKPRRQEQSGMIIPGSIENQIRQGVFFLTKDEGFISGKKDNHNDSQLLSLEEPIDQNYTLKRVNDTTYQLLDRGTV